MSAERIRELLGLMREHGLVELELEMPDFQVKLRKPGAVAPPIFTAQPPLALPGSGVGMLPGRDAGDGSAQFPPPEAAHAAKLTPITSPIVGTFYRSASPDAEPFVQVGARVAKDTVVCIIEAMKVMNEIKAGVAGVIETIPLENGEPVEYGQPLFMVRPA